MQFKREKDKTDVKKQSLFFDSYRMGKWILNARVKNLFGRREF